MTRDHWRWDNDLTVDLFVSWDGADLGGGVSSVGDVPKTVLAFYQRADIAPWQNGHHIEQASEQHELTDLFSHNAITRSAFVHDKTATFIRNTISSVRGKARGGDVVTYAVKADGSLGERIELRRLPADLSMAFANQLGETSYVYLLATESGRAISRRIDDYGMLGALASESTLSPGLTAAASFTIGETAFALLASRRGGDHTAIRRLATDGSIGPRIYPSTAVEQQASSLLTGNGTTFALSKQAITRSWRLRVQTEISASFAYRRTGGPTRWCRILLASLALAGLSAIASYSIGASTFISP